MTTCYVNQLVEIAALNQTQITTSSTTRPSTKLMWTLDGNWQPVCSKQPQCGQVDAKTYGYHCVKQSAAPAVLAIAGDTFDAACH